jgi:hypothetical protein
METDTRAGGGGGDAPGPRAVRGCGGGAARKAAEAAPALVAARSARRRWCPGPVVGGVRARACGWSGPCAGAWRQSMARPPSHAWGQAPGACGREWRHRHGATSPLALLRLLLTVTRRPKGLRPIKSALKAKLTASGAAAPREGRLLLHGRGGRGVPQAHGDDTIHGVNSGKVLRLITKSGRTTTGAKYVLAAGGSLAAAPSAGHRGQA